MRLLPRGRLGRWLAIGAVVLAILISVGGGATYVALGVTTKPEFCASCHIMEPYVESWRNSSHKNVACVDCHYEPGLLETFEGKFKALSQLAKYVTATEGTKPWAEVSDQSCMRSGCHSDHLLEGEIKFGRIAFDHRHHLIGLRRGKRLRCTSCHSQIVQGSHVTVTHVTCILCHFKQSEHGEPLNDCDTCHGPPADDIQLGAFTFRHSEYLERGVACASCHGDVTRGNGEVPKARCGSCHNQEQHLERYDDVVFLHEKHVTDHSVNCFECHTEIEHGLPSRQQHYQGECKDCHTDTHGVPMGLYRGTGGREVPDEASVMFLARVTCNGCHRPPFPGAPISVGGSTWKADPLSCLDCHGPEFDGMMAAWQEETRGHVARVRPALDALGKALDGDGPKANEAEARARYEVAAYNLGLVLLDGSDGVHNLLYVRSLLDHAAQAIHEGFVALDPKQVPARVPVGPAAPSTGNCTNLCHVGIERREPVSAFGKPFPHGKHVIGAKMDCSKCHQAEPHGTTIIRPVDCAACHHPTAEDESQCIACHTEVAALRAWAPDEGDPAPMADFDCLTCHESIAEGHSREAVVSLCADCHDGDFEGEPEAFYASWAATAEGPLEAVDKRLREVGTGSEAARLVKRELEAFRRAGPVHNAAAAQARARSWLQSLD